MTSTFKWTPEVCKKQYGILFKYFLDLPVPIKTGNGRLQSLPSKLEIKRIWIWAKCNVSPFPCPTPTIFPTVQRNIEWHNSAGCGDVPGVADGFFCFVMCCIYEWLRESLSRNFPLLLSTSFYSSSVLWWWAASLVGWLTYLEWVLHHPLMVSRNQQWIR